MEGSSSPPPAATEPGLHRVASMQTSRPPVSIHACGDAAVVALADGRVGALSRDGNALDLDLWTSMAPPARFEGCRGQQVFFVDTGDSRVVIRDVDRRRDVGSVSIDGRVVDAVMTSDDHLWTLERTEESSVAVLRDATDVGLAAIDTIELGVTPLGLVVHDGAVHVADFRGRRVDVLSADTTGETGISLRSVDLDVRPVGLVIDDDAIRIRTMNGTEAPAIEEPSGDETWPWPVSLAVTAESGLWIHGSSTAGLARLEPGTLSVVGELGTLPDVVALIDLGDVMAAVQAGDEPALVYVDAESVQVVERAPLDAAPAGALAWEHGVVVLVPETGRIELWHWVEGS